MSHPFRIVFSAIIKKVIIIKSQSYVKRTLLHTLPLLETLDIWSPAGTALITRCYTIPIMVNSLRRQRTSESEYGEKKGDERRGKATLR